jgi:heme oxygenase
VIPVFWHGKSIFPGPVTAIYQRPVLAELKELTGAAHTELDDYLALTGDITRDRYSRILLAFRDAHVALTTELIPHARELAAFGYELNGREKIAWLESDLAYLSADTFESTPARANIPSAAAAFGAIYVIEGATLGGQVIRRHVIPKLGFAQPDGCRYFQGYGEKTGEKWKATREAIARFSDSTCQGAEVAQTMISSALATFKLFHEMSRLHLECPV